MEQPYTVDRPRLATDWTLRLAEYDVVVIGSGYGGAIAAARLATAEWPDPAPTICLLERGREIRPGEFPDNVVEAAKELHHREHNPLGLYKFHADADIGVFQGSGLGGTSLVNANVAYEPEPGVFDDARWPKAIRRARDAGELALLFERVRLTLDARPHPSGDALPKVRALKQGASKHGDAPHFLNDIAVNFRPDGANRWGVPQRRCVNCGDCVSGCNVGAKNTLDVNYLAIAKHGGVHLFPQVEVIDVSEDGQAGRRVRYKRWTGEKRDGKPVAEEGAIRARRAVIVAAGSPGSPEILLRSAKRGLRFSKALGKGFGGNGDFFGVAYNSDLRTDVLGWGASPFSTRARKLQPAGVGSDPQDMRVPGPTIVSTARYNRNAKFAERVTVQDTSIPLMYVDVARGGLAVAIGIDTDALDFGDNLREMGRRLLDLGAVSPELQAGALNHTLVYLAMGADGQDGRLELGSNGNVKIKWRGVGKQWVFKLQDGLLKKNAKALGATFIRHPLWALSPFRTLVTVHPLGGCVMGESPDEGVVDERGRVFSRDGSTHRGLYVSDASIIPAPIGANPFLTISALAERVAEAAITDLGGRPTVRSEISTGASAGAGG